VLNFLITIAVGWLFMAIVMALLWLIQRRIHDAGIVDVAWGSGIGLLTLGYALTADGDVARRIVVAVLTLAWAIRLSGYVLRRVLSLPEDGRYVRLKEKWGDSAQSKMFGFYQMQAIASLLFSLPMLAACHAEAPFGWLDYVGVSLWFIAVGGESIADWQLHRFRQQPSNRGQVCQSGLWRYSRHPNYFFEWLHWWAYVCFAVAIPVGWLSLLAPLAILYLLLNVTGIPPTEEQALKSRGEAYRRYQETTSPFFPWFPQSSKSKPA
jgi:steroid 5-alpha reductase family enzyme